MAAGAGSNVSLTLYFLRFALATNLALCLVWLACTVVPFMIWPPALFSWASFQDYLPLQLLQGYGLHNTFLLYGAASTSSGAWCMSRISQAAHSREGAYASSACSMRVPVRPCRFLGEVLWPWRTSTNVLLTQCRWVQLRAA